MTVDPEAKFGIKIQSRRASKTLEQKYAILAGAVYATIGVVGFFFTGFTTNVTEMTSEALFGLFLINPFHNVVHLAVGVIWIAAGLVLTPVATEGVNFAIGGFYALAAILGFLGYLSLVSVPGGNDLDNYLHLFSALVTLIFGAGLFRAMGVGADRQAVNA